MDELRLVAPPAADRLPAMLFLAALIHGVLIIGLGFNPELPKHFANALSLEVTIVADPDQRIERPDDAQYLAQASQQGGGNTSEETRASAPLLNESPIDNQGAVDGEHFVDTRELARRADDLLASSGVNEQQIRADTRLDPERANQQARLLESGAQATLPLPQEADATLKIHDDEKRELIVSADTRESIVASYLDSWKRRVERVGAEHLPPAVYDLNGAPTLEVSIDASGQLAGVVVRKSSGSPVLDQAALDILRRASPFDPFPPEVRAEFDQLRFAYKWLFGDSDIETTLASNQAL